MNIKHILILTLALFLIVPNGFSPGTLTDEDTQWIENFDEMFEQNPLEGFSRNINRAWEFLQNSPQRLAEFGRDVISRAFETSSENFVDLVDSERSLLEDPDVREFYELAIAQNPLTVTKNTKSVETFNRFLELEGIEGPGSNINFQVLSYSQETGVFTIRREGGEIVTISKENLRNNQGKILSDGRVQMGEITINDGNVNTHITENLQISSSRSNRLASVEIEGTLFSSEEFLVGINDPTFGNFVRTVSTTAGPPIQIGNEMKQLTQGSFGFNNGIKVFQGESQYRSLKQFDTIDGLPSIDRRIKSSQPIELVDVEASCSGLKSCIINQDLVMGVKNPSGIISIETFNQEVRYSVDPFQDQESMVLITSRVDGTLPYQLRLTQEGIEKVGFNNNNGISVRAFTEDLTGNMYEHSIIYSEDEESSRINSRLVSGTLGGPQLPEILNNVNWDEVNIVPGLAVNTMNNLGLPNDLQTRWQLYNELVELGLAQGGHSRGSAAMNTQLVEALQTIQQGERPTQVGLQANPIFELDPNFERVLSTQGVETEQQLPPSLQGANFANVNFNDPSIVSILNQMGLDSSFAAREQLYRELYGREPPTGDRGAQMNMDLREALGELHAEGVISTRGGGATGQVFEPLTQQQIAQGQRMTPRGQNFDGSVIITNLPPGLRRLHPNGMTVDEAAARILFGECRGKSCTDTEIRLLADVMRNRAYRHNGNFREVFFRDRQFQPIDGFQAGRTPSSNGLAVATTSMNDPNMQRALRIWRESAQGDTSNGATHFYTNPANPSWGHLLVSTVPPGVNTIHRIGYLSQDDPFRPAVVRARNE